jgi:hypothetical protein
VTALISLDKRPRLNELQQREGKHYETRVCVCVCSGTQPQKFATYGKMSRTWESPFGPLKLSREIVIVNCISRRALRRCLMSPVVGVCVCVGDGVPSVVRVFFFFQFCDIAKSVIIHKRI